VTSAALRRKFLFVLLFLYQPKIPQAI